MQLKTVPQLFMGIGLLGQVTLGCMSHESLEGFDIGRVAHENTKFRERSEAATAPPKKIAIDNVRVFTGCALSQPRTVVIDGSVIGSNTNGAHHIDAKGATLIPGLIDAHCHPMNGTHLEQLTQYGVTTAFSMACFEPQMCTSLQNIPGYAGVVAGSAPAAAPGSIHGRIVTAVDPSLLVNSSSETSAWMQRQLAGNPDFVKLIAESPGLSQETLTNLTKLAQLNQKPVAIHASDKSSFKQAIIAGAEHIQHTPLDKTVSKEMALKMVRQGQTSTPTLTMMRAIAKLHPDTSNYEVAKDSVCALHDAGVTIMVGTDANMQTGTPAAPPFGITVHEELENLVEAGLTNLQALRAATIVTATHYGLHDRGIIAPGMRADMVLIRGDPLVDIKNARNILKVWVGGVEFSAKHSKV